MKALLIHYEIKVKSLYEMIYVDSFMAHLQPASENGNPSNLQDIVYILVLMIVLILVFALSFDFVRLVAIGNERRFHTQAFTELENSRRNQILSWKWNSVGSNVKDR
jgi:hypothetical protein